MTDDIFSVFIFFFIFFIFFFLSFFSANFIDKMKWSMNACKWLSTESE